MRITADLHTHTVYSHGKGTIEDNVRAALARGLAAVAITDHGPGHFFIGIKGPPAFWRMKKEIVRLRYKYPDIDILFGVEANIVDVDGAIDVPASVLRELDILLVGYHKLVRPRGMAAFCLGARNFLAGWTGRTGDDLRRRNTRAVCEAVRRYPVDAITHPGLQIDIDTGELGRVCAEQGTALEINSSYAGKLEGYLATILETEAGLVINSDAHTPDKVGDFSAALRLAERLSVPEERIINRAGNLKPKRRKLGA